MSLGKKERKEITRKVFRKRMATGSLIGGDLTEKKAARLMPIAHDTALSPITLASKELKVPGKYFQIVRCFRPDIIDATHGVEFNQMGGIVIDGGRRQC